MAKILKTDRKIARTIKNKKKHQKEGQWLIARNEMVVYRELEPIEDNIRKRISFFCNLMITPLTILSRRRRIIEKLWKQKQKNSLNQNYMRRQGRTRNNTGRYAKKDRHQKNKINTIKFKLKIDERHAMKSKKEEMKKERNG